MEKSTTSNTTHRNFTPGRIGFRYYPDTLHYRESDLHTWLPELQALNAGWLLLQAPPDRAVPEGFLKTLIRNGIQPILQMQLSLSQTVNPASLAVLFQAYASWGVKYVVLFDQPNTQQAWGSSGWVQQQLVARFLDRFIPLAEQVCQAGMHPVFPGLQPGGHFWDTVFLRSALQGIKTRGHTRLLEELVLGTYAWPQDRPLDWGAGGPQAWPGVSPYDTPNSQQDQQGFRIFEWYAAIAESAIGRSLPILLLGTGTAPTNQAYDGDTNLQIAKMLADPNTIPPNIIGGCFHLVEGTFEGTGAKRAVLTSAGEQDGFIGQLKNWIQSLRDNPEPPAPTLIESEQNSETPITRKPIRHYLLLPHPKSGNPDWLLKVIQPYVKKYAPTTGYAVREAFYAHKVTIVGGAQVFPEDLKAMLEKSGTEVIQIDGSGTEIATLLAEL